ncbi:ecto-ADP-ribosyltransferase 5-like [Leptodactylus fuscus]|uniref:ecto-ADP-ribosyltransferase 5-like n=1 Tax=Leptodactylus fuscus TaxID=238119 RepID=UPI003F4E57B1
MSYCLRSLTVLCSFVIIITSQDNVVETLDLAEEAFDDQYLGCKIDMEKKLAEDDVLNKEIRKNKRLNRAWREANNQWLVRKGELKAKLPQEFKDNHGIALLMYTSFIRKDFINAMKSGGRSYKSYMEDFGYKWLHFYVTSALQLLSETRLSSHETVYSGIDDPIELPLNGSKYIKFGGFLYTSLNKNESTLMGNTSLLIIDTYTGINIENFSEYPCEREVLFPGYEIFQLSHDTEEDTYRLNSTKKFCSNFNCAYIKGETSKQSVEECMKNEASLGRMYRPGCLSLVTLLLVFVVTLL